METGETTSVNGYLNDKFAINEQGGYLYVLPTSNTGSQPVANGGFIPTEKVYSYVPGSDLPEAERNMITGVQANLWTEHIPTPEYAEYMLYPRALALAEIGWNGTKTKNYPEFKTRALAQVEHLKAEGVNPFELKKEIGK